MRSFKNHIVEAAKKIHPDGSIVAFPHKGKMTTGKVVRYDKGDKHGTPFYVVDHGDYRSATPPAHKVERVSALDERVSFTPMNPAEWDAHLKKRDAETQKKIAARKIEKLTVRARVPEAMHAIRLKEETQPKFQRAIKTAVHYQGQINGKTYVVPHSFHGSHDVLHGTKTTEIRHAIVTSPTHIQHNNPTLTPEEVMRVHSHIKDIHGVAVPFPLKEAIKHGDEVKIHNYGLNSGKIGVVLHPNKVRTNGRGVPTDVPGAYKPVDHKKEHVVKLHDGSHAVVPKGSLRPTNMEYSNLEERALTTSEDTRKEEIVMSMKKNLQSFKERYGKDAKSVMYATATKQSKALAENEQLDELSKGTLKSYIKKAAPSLGIHGYMSGSNQRRGETAKKEVRGFFLKQGAESEAIAKKREAGIVRASGKLEEAAPFMTTYRRNESANRHTANIVHLAKHFGTPDEQAEAKFYHDELKRHGHQPHHEKTFALHQKLYPKAVAAHKESHPAGKVRLHKEQIMTEELHAYDVHHKGKHIDTIFYGHHEESESVKKSLVNHDGYHPDITVKKQPKKKLKESSPTFKTVKSVLSEAATRALFRRVADGIKRIGDMKDRQMMADHNAAIFAKQNPRFSHEKFHAAAGTVHKKD